MMIGKVLIKSRAGKATGKWSNCFNVKNLDTDEEKWMNFENVEEIKDDQENENDEFNEEDEDENIVREWFTVTQREENKNIKTAKINELKSWMKNEVYEELERDEVPEKEKIIGTRWIITEKEKEGEKTIKARLVAKGFMENSKENELNCKAPTCSPEGLKVVLSVIKRKGWVIQSIDIKTAYFQSKKIEKSFHSTSEGGRNSK